MNGKATVAALAALVAGLAAGGAKAAAQEPVRTVGLDEALESFHRNSPELQLARNRLRMELGRARQSRALPNPELSMTHEALGEYSESYAYLSQPIDFLWDGGSRRSRAGAAAAGARSRFAADSARMVLELKRAYLAAWRERETVSALRQADALVQGMVTAAEARFAEGDLAGYDLRRLRIERSRSARRLALAELRQEDAERQLGSLVSQSGEPALVTAGEAGTQGVTLGDDPVAVALRQRPEVAAAGAAVDALRAEASLAGSSAFRNTSLLGGIKRQSDGSDGVFFGLAVPLPIADRRGGAMDAANAAVAGAEVELELVRRTIAREVSMAASRLDSFQRQLALLPAAGAIEAQDLLGIARLAYEEGETRVVDLLDAADAYVEARLFETEVRTGYLNAVFELERAVGGFGVESDNGANER